MANSSGALSFLVLLLGLRSSQSGLWGWDFGRDNLVFAGVLPNSVEVVLNSMSQRRTPCRVILGHEKNRRLLGEECLSERRGVAFGDLLALLFGEEDAQLGARDLNVDVPFEPREQSLEFLRENNATQIAAMLLAHTLKQDKSERVGGVCTAPVSASWAQRAALLDAMFVAGVGEGQVVDGGSCVAAYYGLLKLGSQAQQHSLKDPVCLLVDVGYSSLSATLCRFNCLGERVLGAKVLAQQSTSQCGTKLLDDAIFRIIEKALLKQKDRLIGGKLSPRLAARVRKAANKAKTVLSANTEASWDVECAFEDGGDARGLVSRTELEKETGSAEAAAAALCNQVVQDGLQRLKDAGGSLESFAESLNAGVGFEVTGGGAAVPMVKKGLERGLQTALDKRGISASGSLGRSMNPFEAPALGAALLAAINSGRISRGSRLRRFELESALHSELEVEVTAYLGKHIRRGSSRIPKGASFPSTRTLNVALGKAEKASGAEDRWDVQVRLQDHAGAARPAPFCWTSEMEAPEDWNDKGPSSVQLQCDLALDVSSFPQISRATVVADQNDVPLKLQACEVPFRFAPYPGVTRELEERQEENLRHARALEAKWVEAEAEATAAENARNEVEALLYEIQSEMRDETASPAEVHGQLLASRVQGGDLDAVERIRVAAGKLAFSDKTSFLYPMHHGGAASEHLDSFGEIGIEYFLGPGEKMDLAETLGAVERDLDETLSAAEWQRRRLSILTTRRLGRERRMQWTGVVTRLPIALDVAEAAKALLEEDWEPSVKAKLEEVEKAATGVADDVAKSLKEPWQSPSADMQNLEELRQCDLLDLLESLRKEQRT